MSVTLDKITDPGTRVWHSVYGTARVIAPVGTFKIQIQLDAPIGTCGLFKITSMRHELTALPVRNGEIVWADGYTDTEWANLPARQGTPGAIAEWEREILQSN